jgi:hypothetical protein
MHSDTVATKLSFKRSKERVFLRCGRGRSPPVACHGREHGPVLLVVRCPHEFSASAPSRPRRRRVGRLQPRQLHKIIENVSDVEVVSFLQDTPPHFLKEDNCPAAVTRHADPPSGKCASKAFFHEKTPRDLKQSHRTDSSCVGRPPQHF